MKAQDNSNQGFVQALLRLGLGHPNAIESLACKGTVVESATVKVGSKAFLFVRPTNVMVKVGASVAEATKLAAAEPARYSVGKNGWVTIKLKLGEPTPALTILERWIAESYWIAAGQPAQAAPAARSTSPTKKKVAAKTKASR